ncbi:MAG: DUF4093 domain-containing protein [Oscillospiraceae bacterium]|jgi:ribonuclease M5|nr:DUF4093 domain-containing protein [Oscillospiraceae bacterium]
MSAPLRIREAVVVEGRYDKAALSGVVDTLILETAGFSVFKDGERLAFLRRLAAKRGLIVLTDSDGAGFVIRNYLKGAIPKDQLKHAYIPDVFGKERRKRAPGKEGKLGVEGMSPDVLRNAILRAGATVLDGDAPDRPQGDLTPADLFALGLSGTPDAAAQRAELLGRLDLPQHMSAKALLSALNALYTPDELETLLDGFRR